MKTKIMDLDRKKLAASFYTVIVIEHTKISLFKIAIYPKIYHLQTYYRSKGNILYTKTFTVQYHMMKRNNVHHCTIWPNKTRCFTTNTAEYYPLLHTIA